MATIKLTNYSDYVDNSNNYQYGAANHTWYLLKGEDELYGGTGRDTVYGADGADNIHGGDGNDTLYGDRGWDFLGGGNGTDVLYGGAGNDTLAGAYYDNQYDVLIGNIGNDTIIADGDKVNAGDGNDWVIVDMRGGQRADVTLGLGSDTLQLDLWEQDYANYNEGRIDVRDFKAGDKLTLAAYGPYYQNLDHGQVLDRLDTNNDGWLGAKDVEAQDYDEMTVYVGQNSLTLDVFDTEIVFAGMTKASFDFLA